MPENLARAGAGDRGTAESGVIDLRDPATYPMKRPGAYLASD